MEVRIARLTTLLNRAVEGTNKSNNDTKDNSFMSNLPTNGKTDQNDQSAKKEMSSKDAMISLSSKGAKHSGILTQISDTESDGSDSDSDSSKFEQMTRQLRGLSTQVVNGQFSSTDKMNFDTELKLLSALLKNADNESKCDILSERINNLSRIVNSAAVYSDMDLAVFKLIDPNYSLEDDNKINMGL